MLEWPRFFSSKHLFGKCIIHSKNISFVFSSSSFLWMIVICGWKCPFRHSFLMGMLKIFWTKYFTNNLFPMIPMKNDFQWNYFLWICLYCLISDSGKVWARKCSGSIIILGSLIWSRDIICLHILLHRKKNLCSKICKQIMSLDQMRDPISHLLKDSFRVTLNFL